MNTPKYSLIIPTYNRLNEIKELIESLKCLQVDTILFELIIVDDGSTDGTEEYIKQLATHFHIQYIKQANKGPGQARNNGMDIATGEYFIFIDSDCLLPENYFLELESYLNDKDLDAFGGPDTYHPSFSPLLKAINYSMTSFLGTGGTRGSENSVTKFYPRSFNMGINKKVYHKIGGFSNLRHGQDMDYSARIYDAGFNVGFIHKAFVYHKRRTSMWRFFKQIHNWGVTRINLAAMHPDMLKPIHFAPAFIVVFVILTFIASPFLQIAILGAKAIILSAISVALLAFYQSYRMYGSFKISVLSIVTLFWQVFAYGIGSLNGIWQKWILKKPLAIGITKNYYK